MGWGDGQQRDKTRSQVLERLRYGEALLEPV